MEAKSKFGEWERTMGTEESKNLGGERTIWDNAMGDESNEFHREVVGPKVMYRTSIS